MHTTHRRAVRLREAARELLGYDRLRPGQEEAVRAAISGRDTLAVLPTGSGKSAIYQLAGAQLEGPTVVVSPLLALQRDQLAAIEGQDLPPAALLNSTLSQRDRDAVLAQLGEGALEFLFLAPEQFANADVMKALARARPSLFVVDEAHCCVQWGHDFRPEYARLGAVAAELGGPVILALTATAAPPVRDEIVRTLGMEEPAIVVRDFDRPNIRLAVEPFSDEPGRDLALVERVATTAGAGIVYAATRKRTEALDRLLQAAGVSAAAYHAGLPAARREAVEAAFMAGALRVIVATAAFGMGIDKPDVRFVYHAGAADSLDSYYQEMGRAGRDGETAEAVLFYRAEDLGLRRYLNAPPAVGEEDARRVYHALAAGCASAEAVATAASVAPARARAVLATFAAEGWLVLAPGGALESLHLSPEATAAAAVAAAAARRRAYEASRVEMVRSYAETRSCRRAFLLSYFGEARADACGNCDACDAGPPADPVEAPFAPQARVRHPRWGQGSVVRSDPGRVTVLFDEAGYRTLALAVVLAEGLLEVL